MNLKIRLEIYRARFLTKLYQVHVWLYRERESWRIKLFNTTRKFLGMPDFHVHLKKAVTEIRKLEALVEEQKKQVEEAQREVSRLDRTTSLDVRSAMEMFDLNTIGPVLWIKVSDNRLLRYDTFNQIRDYLKGRMAEPPLLIVTGNEVELRNLTEEDLFEVGLQKMRPNERN